MIAAIAALALLSFLNGLTARAAESDLLESLRSSAKAARQGFDQIPAERQGELRKAAQHVQSRLQAGEPAQMTFICTHNSRRSHLAQVWAQTAATYYGLKGVRTFSGGTEATACNVRTVRALQRAGFQIPEPAPAGNPVYQITYARGEEPIRAFSKVYSKEGNPTANYVALMCCGNADRSCPLVKGAALRLSINYDDPKAADGTPDEEVRYDERCRQIAREMFYLMSLVRPGK